MISCDKCRFAVATTVELWPIVCHLHGPTILIDNDDAACWPEVSAKDATVGCGDGKSVHVDSIHDLRLSVRARNALMRLHVVTLGQILDTTALDLVRMKNCGDSTVTEIREMLALRGLSLKGEYVTRREQDG